MIETGWSYRTGSSAPIYGSLRGYISVETGTTFHMLLNFRKDMLRHEP